MRQVTLICLFVLAAALASCSVSDKPVADYPIQPVAFNEVTMTDPFWLSRIETNRISTIPFALEKIRETGRMDNFLKASGRMEGPHLGKRYNDSDVYKVIEGIAYSLKTHPDPELESYTDSLIREIALAQEPDGYLFTGRTIDPENPAPGSGKERWINLNGSHELYNGGHLYEAAVAWYQSTGKSNLLDVAIRNADLLVSTFGPEKRHVIPGHQEVELALVKLYRVTGNRDYLDLAGFFLDQRGREHHFEPYPDSSIFALYNGKEYMQDHLPVLEQKEAVGHAVRAVYMYTGMADYAAIAGDLAYAGAIKHIWEDVVNHKMYLTGGIGSRHTSEAFGDRYELPNRSAYTETCASIGSAFWNQRLFLLSGESKYYDILERTLYNGLISGVSLSGDRFFYQNPLEALGDYTRSEWFEVSCCPGNMVRFLPSLPGYIYAVKDQRIFVNLLISSSTKIGIGNREIEVSISSELPWDGRVVVDVNPERAVRFELAIRIPGWSRGEAVPGDLYQFTGDQDPTHLFSINGETVPAMMLQSGYWIISRTWKPGDQIVMQFDMPARLVVAHNELAENAGKVAIQRGPMVYCFESPDNPGVDFQNLQVDAGSDIIYRFDTKLLNGTGTLKIKGYHDGSPTTPVELTAIPYFAWSNRGLSQMKVWTDSLR